jgi:hypothetical protein
MRHARVAALTAAILSYALVASADTITVTTASDSGAGSLRAAITSANAAPGDHFIHFAIGTGHVVLSPATPYPTTAGKIIFSGESQPGFQGIPGALGSPVIEIDASNLSAPAFHLTGGSVLSTIAINGDHAAAIELGDGASIQACYIGTDASGNYSIANGTGVLITGAGALVIGSLISGNTTAIEVTASGVGSSIYNNKIGLSPSGTTAVPNGTGVIVNGNGSSAALTIGINGLPNIIAGNTGAAIRIQSFNSVTITGNYIGVADYTGRAMGNGGNGIELAGSNNSSITENLIENNGGTAIWVGGGSGAQSGNLISKNSIARNAFGIDLGDTRDGHTANDALDGDSGPNGLQNHPVILSAVDNLVMNGTPTSTITGTLASKANSGYAIELYLNTNCTGDYTAAETYLTTLNVTTDSSGNASFSTTLNNLYTGAGSISATATDAQNNTSEVSNCAVIQSHGKLRFAEWNYDVLETAGHLTVTVVRAEGSIGTVSVNYATTPAVPTPGEDIATPGADYTATSGTLTFAEGEVSKTITIPILDDNLYELTEMFNVTLSNPTGGAILDFKFVTQVGIMDNEPQSKITISDTSVIEGNSGTTYARFPITITPAAGFPITVNLKTGCCESATENEDYQMITGSVTFAPGESMKTFDVPVFGDTKYERDEVFGASIVSFSPENTISNTNFGAHATIVNDDVGKVSCTPSVSALEGPSGTSKSVEITCTADSPFAGGVYYKTADGTAHAAEQDYMFGSGSIVFNPGFPTAKFSVLILGDDTVEPDEQFTINLQADPAEGWNFVVEPAAITVTILNDDTPGVVTCIDAMAAEGNSGFSNVQITCVSPTPISGTIDYATRNGTALAPSDYVATTGTLTFDNEKLKTFTVSIAGDTAIEPDETFTIDLTPHPNALNPFTPGRNSVVVTILNDDQPPQSPQVLLAPGRLFMTLGDNVPVRASIEPPSSTETTLTVTVQDPSVIDAPTTVVLAPGQPAFFPVTAKKHGSTAIIVTAGTGITGTFLLADVAEGKPTLTSLEPAAGPATGGVTVSLKGTNLTSGCLVSVGGMPATSPVFSSATAATFIAPAHTTGTVDVTLTCGSSTATLSNAFTYAAVRGRAARH